MRNASANVKNELTNEELILNSNHVNSKIKARILPDNDMRNAGFTQHVQGKWYYCKSLRHDISFNVTIPTDGSDINIEVLDEDFLQPYDYQKFIADGSSNDFPYQIRDLVENEMDRLQELGVLSGHVRGEYI